MTLFPALATNRWSRRLLSGGAPGIVDGVTPGADAFVLAEIAAQIGEGKPVIHVAGDGQSLPLIADALRFVAPGVPLLELPAWDCLPYDRVSPGADTAARRLSALSGLAALRERPHPAIILTTANAALQKAPPPDIMLNAALTARSGSILPMARLVERLERQGFDRVATVREVGEYAVRGGILDLHAPGAENPIRLDFFGDQIESIRAFDAASQRSLGPVTEFALNPASEVELTPESIARFRKRYIELFGAPSRDDALYAAVSEGRRFAGLEHWLPLFHDRLASLFDYVPEGVVVFDHAAHQAIEERHSQILDHFEARNKPPAAGMGQSPYHPVAPDTLYLSPEALTQTIRLRARVDLSAFSAPPGADRVVLSADARKGRTFAAERNDQNANVFDAVVRHINALGDAGKSVLIAGWTEGSLDRLMQMLTEHDLGGFKKIDSFADMPKGKARRACAVLPLEEGFETDDFALIAEQDILGDRLSRALKKKRKNADFIAEVTSLATGDIVVHVDHGIGRFVGLRTVTVSGAPHDCLEIHYAGDGRLLLPVENIELLSRYGSDEGLAQLDRLGGGAWQARKAKLKKRLLDMAGQLIRIAAERATRGAPVITVPDGLYGEFSARFPYEPTEDQAGAIEAVIDDFTTGAPMDRLVCGDVGFGKTEVALRAAFLAAMEGLQVAVTVPTTLLSRQHYKTFSERFTGLPLRVRHLSRLVPAKEAAETKALLAEGKVDIVVGTHALLSESIKFKRLGLLVIDEEQRFGVKHKERLKELKSDVHVLTLTATPIPRTLQLALSGVRELSLISTPPVDRLSVRTFVTPFDPVVIRETLLRERYRGGQSFYVVPRIKDIEDVMAFLRSDVPELRVAVAHGQMAPTELEDVMNAFYDNRFDVLLSTTIIESGLDIPSANTMIVHRADMFGLSQLYQLRGRVGRSKLRAYALLTVPAKRILTDTADRRLKVLQSLDSLGAGFQLASHDLDIRGAGNLLGDEQSGHIKEVGFELYQQMLEEAVAEMRGTAVDDSGNWSPTISVGTAVMIPEAYVSDLQLRLSLYRRLAELESIAEIDAFGAELIDRFGPMPEEVEHLLKVVYIKALCRQANVEKLDTGPKGAVVHFRNKEFANPAALIKLISAEGSLAKIRPDQSVVFTRDWPTPEKRLGGSAVLMTRLAKAAAEAG
jgi:transcription-repair coupling factor (superfamily II helicase)